MDYEAIVLKIIETTGLPRQDIDIKIADKQAELSGLVSKEGAAYIIAKELGLDLFERSNRRLEVKNVVPGIKNLNITVRILRVFEPREFEYKGEKGKVANMILTDGTANIKMSLWNEQCEQLDMFKVGAGIEIFGAYTKDDGQGNAEIRLSRRGGVKLLETCDLPEITSYKPNSFESKRISIAEIGENGPCEVRAALVQLFETGVFYEVCPQCSKRLKKDASNAFSCEAHGKVEPSFMIILSGVIDDGSGNMRAVFFRDAATNLIGMTIEEALKIRDGFFEKVDALGKEFIFTGQLKTNQMFNRKEFVVNKVRDLDIKTEATKIINTLENNQ